MIAPILEEVAADHDEIVVAKLNVDENPSTAAQYGVTSIPTMNVFSGARSSSRSSARSRRRPCSRTSATTSTDGWPDSVTPDRLSRKFATG